MDVKQMLIYVSVGSLLGIIVFIVLMIIVFKKCIKKRCQVKSPSDNNNTTVTCSKGSLSTAPSTGYKSSIDSGSDNSKKLLMTYGTTLSKSLSANSIPSNAQNECAKIKEHKPTSEYYNSGGYYGDNAGYRRSTNSSLEYCGSQPSTDSETTHSSSTFRSKSSSINIEPHTIGAIRPDLYTRKGSMFTQSCLKERVIGRIHLRLKYDFNRSDLIATLVEVKDTSSAIVECCLKVFLSHDPASKIKQSKFARARCSRFEFNEQFKFPIAFDELSEKTLIVQLHDHSSSTAGSKSNKYNVLLGEMHIDLCQIDPSADIEIVADIEPIKPEDDCFGEILLSIIYLPSVERLSLTVVKSKWKSFYESDSAEYYVKANVLIAGKVWKKKRTTSKSTARQNPNELEWNEELSFHIQGAKMVDAQMDITLTRKRQKEHAEIVGLVVLAADAPTIPGKQHWKGLLKHNGAVTRWHRLQYCPTTNRRYSD